MPSTKVIYKTNEWTKIRSVKRLKGCLASVNFVQPQEDWTQQRWDREWRGLVIEPFDAVMSMHGLKLIQRRGGSCKHWTDMPCLIKTSKKQYTYQEVSDILDTKHLREKLWIVPEFRENQYNIDFWLQLLDYYYDKFVYICTFSMEENDNINYSWKKVCEAQREYDDKWDNKNYWYMTSISKINGNFGVTYGQSQHFGTGVLSPIRHSYAKKVIINHSTVKRSYIFVFFVYFTKSKTKFFSLV